MNPTDLGLWAITPAPMTPDEVAELVERVRFAMRNVAGGIHLNAPGSVPPDVLADRRAQRAAAYEQALASARAMVVEPPRNPQFPPGVLCSICTGSAIGALHREPLGRNGALVNVCVTCSTEVPREGQYAFGGSGHGLGAGNRRVGSGGSR